MRKVFLKIFLIFLVIVVLTYSMYMLSKSRTFQLQGELISRYNVEEKYVALTFDDGPAQNTEEVLNILREYNIKATFFLTGREINENKELAKMIVKDNHDVGNHSYSHKRMVFKSLDFIDKEIEETDGLIREIGYKGEIYFRPPNCKKLFLLPHYLSKNNRLTITWDLEPDSIPEISNDPSKMNDYVNSNIKPGSIILMHVMYENREASIEALPLIIKDLEEKNYEFKTISELDKENPKNK